MEPQEIKKKSTKKGWLEDIKGKYSSMMNAGSAKNISEEKDKNEDEVEKEEKCYSEGEEDKGNKDISNTNNDDKTNGESIVNTDASDKKKGKGKKNSIPELWNGLDKERKEFFEVKKKYYFIEMTKFHQNRENCANNFLDLLEKSYDKMLEFLKRGTVEINMLQIFFKELIKNDSTYAKMVTGANSKINNLTHSFLNLPSDHLLTSQQKLLGIKKPSSELQIKKTDKLLNDNIDKEQQSIQGNSTKDYENVEQSKNNKKKYTEKEKEKEDDDNDIDHNSINNLDSNNIENNEKKPKIYELQETNIIKSPSEEFEKTVDEMFNGGLPSSVVNHYSITDWISHSFMNYTKYASNMKLSCEMMDSHIFQNKLFLLKDTYLKEQELLIDGFKRKKYELVKQMELCRYYWKSFENSYMNSDRYKTDENNETKKSKCSWLCQRKYLKNVKLLLLLQKEYIEILSMSIKVFFQLEEWKKNSLRNMLSSYILLYRSFLGFYMNNLNTLYDSLLQEKSIEKAQFDNLNAETLFEDVLRPVESFTFDENCTSIPKLNYALDVINKNSELFDPNISLKSVLCLFSAPISGYLTSVGIFNKMVEGILVISWDRFIHFFASKEDSSPQWSYNLNDIDFKIVKSKRNKKTSTTNKEEGKATTTETTTATNTLHEKQKNVDLSLEERNKEIMDKKKQRKSSYISSASSNASSSKEKENSQEKEKEKEEQPWEICLREKRKTLLISGWSLSFTCDTSHLTKVCFELLKNHLNSQCYQKQDPFTHCMQLVGSGEIMNDLSNTHNFSEFVILYQDLPEGTSLHNEDKEESPSQQEIENKKKENKQIIEQKRTLSRNEMELFENVNIDKSKEETNNEKQINKNELKENKEKEKEKEKEDSVNESDSDDDSESEEDSDDSDSDDDDSDESDSDESDSEDEEDIKLNLQNKKNKIKGNNTIIEGEDIKEE